MVWPFSKKRVIDLTEQSMPIPRKRTVVSESNGYADLTAGQSPSTSTSSGSGVTDFFSAVSEASNTSSSISGNLEAQGMKNKIEDVEYKIDALRKKLDDLLDRFEVVERRVTFRRENNN